MAECAVVFDLDGTLTGKGVGSIFTEIERRLLPHRKQEFEKMRDKYKPLVRSGELTEAHEREWMAYSIDFYSRELNIRDISEAIRNIPLRSGVIECMAWHKERGIPMAIISAGIRQFIDVFIRTHELPVDDVFAAEVQTAPDGRITGWLPETMVTLANKGIHAQQFANSRGVSVERLFGVGDSTGDRQIVPLKENRLGIVRRPDRVAALAGVMGTVVVSDDFASVFAWLRQKIG